MSFYEKADLKNRLIIDLRLIVYFGLAVRDEHESYHRELELGCAETLEDLRLLAHRYDQAERDGSCLIEEEVE